MIVRTVPGVDRHRGLLVAAIILLAITALAHWADYAPIVHSDDWVTVRWLTENVESPWGLDRPLVGLPFRIAHGAFGQHIIGFHVVLSLVQLLTAVTVMLLFHAGFRCPLLMSFGVAALWLVYPADATAMWLIMLGIRVAYLLAALYLLLLWRYVRTGSTLVLFLSLTCLASSFLMYEAQLGVLIAGTCLLLIENRTAPPARLSRATVWSGSITALFVTWRALVVPIFLHGGDSRFSKLTLSPPTLLDHLVLGAKVLVLAWVRPLETRFPGWDWRLTTTGLVALALLCAGYLLSALARPSGHQPATRLGVPDGAGLAGRAIGVGFVLATAGYVPLVAFAYPRLSAASSRWNSLAQVGAATSMMGFIALLAILAFRSSRARQISIGLILTLLLAVGSLVQVSIRSADRAAWEEKRTFWTAVQRKIPGLLEDTVILLQVESLRNLRIEGPTWSPHSMRPIIQAHWELTAALNLFFRKERLVGSLATDFSPGPEGLWVAGTTESATGLPVSSGRVLLPFARLVVLEYRKTGASLRVLSPQDLYDQIGRTPIGYAPHERIAGPTPGESTASRLLNL